MRYAIENENMKVEVESFGAELKSLYGKETGIEYMWCADPEYYKRTAPNLFPVVGTLKNGEYTYKNQTYKMGQHGYVRDMEWSITKPNDSTLVCKLSSDEETKQKYPFDYTLTITYEIIGKRLKVTWNVHNDGDEMMYFSLGFHPCFTCPVHGEENKRGYGYDLHMKGNMKSRNFDYESGLALNTETEVELKDGFAEFTPDFFTKGAYIVENNQTHQVSLKDPTGVDYLTVYFDAPIFGLWSAETKDAPYAAIEPWYGRCDGADFNGTLEEREWGNSLESGKDFARFYEIEIA